MRQQSNALNLYVTASGQGLDCNATTVGVSYFAVRIHEVNDSGSRSCGFRFSPVCLVDLVHGIKVFQVEKKDIDLDDVVTAGSCGC